jgi:[ribosomal protein S18]-alanine N-acetyltransferase
MRRSAVEIRQINAADEAALVRFFAVLQSRGTDRFFHPHPFTVKAAIERAAYSGKDLYYVLIDGSEILGYGMLRGWDEGYVVPSLGIVVHPDAQGKGLGRLLMNFLRVAAERKKAEKIRLRVALENEKATKLYRALGYEFAFESASAYLEGFLDLTKR